MFLQHTENLEKPTFFNEYNWTYNNKVEIFDEILRMYQEFERIASFKD